MLTMIKNSVRPFDINIRDADDWYRSRGRASLRLSRIAIVRTCDNLSNTILILKIPRLISIENVPGTLFLVRQCCPPWRNNVYLETPVVWTYKCTQYMRVHIKRMYIYIYIYAYAVVGWVISRAFARTMAQNFLFFFFFAIVDS